MRLHDNRGLIHALETSNEVLPLFVVDTAFQAIRETSPRRWNFILESLIDLNNELSDLNSKLHVLKGQYTECIKELQLIYPFDAIFMNEDYTPYHTKRMHELEGLSDQRDFTIVTDIDYPLVDPRKTITQKNQPYKVFTPFYRKAQQFQIRVPAAIPDKVQFVKISGSKFESLEPLENSKLVNNKIVGGRQSALETLKNTENLQNYNEERDFPSLNATSMLSPYIRFGNISIREAYQFFSLVLHDPEPLIRQLYWRDFYTYIGFHFPHVFKGNFKRKYDVLSWENDPLLFNKWKEGKTGFPIVDAGMRQLNQTGWMHNRVRMITASFLVKDLLIDWRWGERYFGEQLLDYDPAVNNGSWQWAASTGTDAQPYFRIFNPWTQQKRFDNDCQYIKAWIPELRDLNPKEIHKLLIQHPPGLSYPKPIVDHKERSANAKLMFQLTTT